MIIRAGHPGRVSSTIPNMPVPPLSRQPDALAWFDTLNGQTVLATERAHIRSALRSRSVRQPWLWIAPFTQGACDDLPVPPRSLLLHRQGRRLVGPLECGLPLPLPSESIGNVILQHALEDGGNDLLEECVRVLEPGGRLWLFTLNPLSPYRLRWRGSGLAVCGTSFWQLRLRGQGLQPCGEQVSYFGPLWHPGSATSNPGRLRAICLLQSEKRSAALIPPAPVKRLWQAGAATA